MSQRWLILADDLTGAADAGVAFARRGHRTDVRWGEGWFDDAVAVLAVDLDTRAAAEADAAARHGAAVRRAGATSVTLFKKIDSTLRGHPAVEMAAIVAALRERGRPSWGLLAPANPAMRRTTRDGRVFVDGAPLEASAIWQREHRYPTADLAAVVGSAGLGAIPVTLAELRSNGSALRQALANAAAADRVAGTILIGDAETDGDLDRLVAAARDLPPGFFIGTAGLANALARATPAGSLPHPTLRRTSLGTLVAVGTLATVSRDAARRLAGREGRQLVRITVSAGADNATDEAQVATSIGARLEQGETVVAVLDAPDLAGGAIDPRYARRFAESLDAALEHMGALVVTGGDTAAAVLARCQVHGIGLIGEVEPGVALGTTRGAIDVPIITKPGAFGDENSLVRCLDTLQDLRRHA